MSERSANVGCNEFREYSRRRFMAVGAAGVAAAATLPEWMPNVVLARDYRGAQRDVLIVVFLRGGADALTICPPFLEPNYYASRPTVAVPPPNSSSPNRALNLNGQFGFAPAMMPLLPWYQNGKLLIVHATGSLDVTRSHFDAARLMEIGDADPLTPTGWLSRHLQVTPGVGSTPLRGVAIQDGVPKSLVGATRVLPIPDPANFNLRGNVHTQAIRYYSLYNSFLAAANPVRGYAISTYNTINLINELDIASYVPAGGAAYPETRAGRAMRAAAALTKAEVGVEVMTLDLNVSTWDVHQAQSPFTGAMAIEMDHLSRCLAAFAQDMFTGSAPSFTLVVMSEFGRALAENGSAGTDHGHGGLIMLMGNAIAGGRVLTQWPGLETEQLYARRDLEVTIDYRDVLCEILQTRMGNTALDQVFAGYTPVMRGLYV